MNNYDDIIGLRHHTPRTHSRMNPSDRAAQFAAFAALTGFGAAISETARLTDAMKDIDEYRKESISRKICFMRDVILKIPTVKIKYFVPDLRKQGGKYAVGVFRVKQVDEYKRVLVMDTGEKISFDRIVNLKIINVCS